MKPARGTAVDTDLCTWLAARHDLRTGTEFLQVETESTRHSRTSLVGEYRPATTTNHQSSTLTNGSLGGLMATMRVAAKPEPAPMMVAQISKPGGEFEIVEREIPEPGARQLRIKVQACGVCHSDVFVKEGLWPGIQYPRVPGHEVAGIIDKLGTEVIGWKRGQRVGVGWHGGQDNMCLECRRGHFLYCRNPKVAGISYDGGYQQYMLAPVEALAAIPDKLSDAEAGPLLCAGVTTFNGLRHTGALPGDLVAVEGIGGLGHLGIQFASKFGYKVVAIGRGAENGVLAKKLGASTYVDTKLTNAAEELQKLGGAHAIL